MTLVVSKGTALQIDIATVYTEIAQNISIDGPDSEVLTQELPTLDVVGNGVPVKPTGWVKGGGVSFSMYLDPVAATFQALTDLIATPVVTGFKIIFSDTGATVWPFNATVTKATPKIEQGEYLKADCECMLDGVVTYPT